MRAIMKIKISKFIAIYSIIVAFALIFCSLVSFFGIFDLSWQLNYYVDSIFEFWWLYILLAICVAPATYLNIKILYSLFTRFIIKGS